MSLLCASFFLLQKPRESQMYKYEFYIHKDGIWLSRQPHNCLHKINFRSQQQRNGGSLCCAVGAYILRYIVLFNSVPYPGGMLPPSTAPPSSSTATIPSQQQSAPVIGPQVPNTKPLFPAAQVSSCFYSMDYFLPSNSKYQSYCCKLHYIFLQIIHCIT